MTALKSIGAVFAAFLFVVVTSTVTDVVMHATGVFPPMDAPPMSDALFGFAFAYRTVFTVLSGTLAARLAPGRPMAHAVALGVIGTLAGTAGAVATWDMGLGPRWYAIALAVEALPCVLLGAWAARR